MVILTQQALMVVQLYDINGDSRMRMQHDAIIALNSSIVRVVNKKATGQTIIMTIKAMKYLGMQMRLQQKKQS